MEKESGNHRVLKYLLKNLSRPNSITLISKSIGISRVGVWKILKLLDKNKLVIMDKIGSGKTNSSIIRLNLDNSVLNKRLSLILLEESIKYARWTDTFKELDKLSLFVIIFGSILNNEKTASDVDLLIIAKNKNSFIEIDKIISNKGKMLVKKIHATTLLKNELKIEIKKNNTALIDAIKEGVVLLGQDKFLNFIKEMKQLK